MIRQDHFASEFDVSITDYPSGNSDHLFVAPGASQQAVAIVVEPWRGASWTATFAGPDPGRRALSGLAGTPSPTGLCVVERGTAFLGNVLDPSGFCVAETDGPVVGVAELAHEGLLLLLTPWAITAVDQDGPCWTTQRIAIDGLRLDEASHSRARGVADPGDDESRDFALDLTSGHVIGGAEVS